jgi:hypothetical protein
MTAIVKGRQGEEEKKNTPGLTLREIRTGGHRAGPPERAASGEPLAEPAVPTNGAVKLLHVLTGLIGRWVPNPSAGHIAVMTILLDNPTSNHSDYITISR